MYFRDISPDYLWQNNINPEGLLFGPNFYPYNPNLKQFSRDLRKQGQISEAMLWKYLKNKNFGYVFNRQRPILNYIADFICLELRLVIEIDGASHFTAEAQQQDAERDRQMQILGLTVVRVKDSDVRKNPEMVAKGIMEEFSAKGKL